MMNAMMKSENRNSPRREFLLLASIISFYLAKANFRGSQDSEDALIAQT
jgi:hypothetical protein